MQLENFVNVMGINVIQVIDQIQYDKDSNQKKHVDTDQYINKDWYIIHCRKRKSITKEDEERASKLQTSEYFLSNISSPLRHEGQRRLSYIPTSSQRHHQQQQQQHQQQHQQQQQKQQQQHQQQQQQSHHNKQYSQTSRETVKEHLTKSSISPTTSSSPGVQYGVPSSICKTIDNKELIFPTTGLTSLPTRTQLPDHVINSITRNDHDYNKQQRDTTVETKKSFRDKIRSRIWKRPKSIRWCTSKEFLSRQIKTYRDAYELVQRKREVIVRVKGKIDLSDEYFDVNSTDRLEFILFP